MNLRVDLVATYGLLALTVLSLWRPARWPWILMLVLAAACGRYFALVGNQALLALAAFGFLAWCASQAKGGALRVVLLTLTALMALALSLHRFPGFVNPALVSELRLSANAPAFTHRLNFDTIAAGIILFGLFCKPARSKRDWQAVAAQWPLIAGTPVLVLAAGLALGFVAFDVKFSAYTPVFLLCNLLFTCVTEEAFFRGFLQEQFSKAGPYVALLLTSVLFGIAHFRGGPVYVVLATVAGLGYGYAYLRSKRIEAAIFTHIAVNGLHFVAFSYPKLL